MGEAGESGSGQIFDSGLTGPNTMIRKGKTFEHTFALAGILDYHCKLHPILTGKIIVN